MLQHRITRMLIAALFLVSFVCAQESRHEDHHSAVHDHIVSHIEGIHNHVDAITRRARRLSCYRMISPRMRFPDQWLDYVEENIDTWRKEWVEWFCDVSLIRFVFSSSILICAHAISVSSERIVCWSLSRG